MEFKTVDELHLGQRVRVVQIKDSLVRVKVDQKDHYKVLTPAGTIYEGVVDWINSGDEVFVIRSDNGRKWSFHLPDDEIQVTLLP